MKCKAVNSAHVLTKLPAGYVRHLGSHVQWNADRCNSQGRSYLKRSCLQMFTARERSQLDVSGIWAVTRNQLHTDDSFTFNRMITRIKESVAHLPLADDEEEAALQAIKVCKHSFPMEPKRHSFD